MKNLPDWLIRALKTFVQAFFGVLVPEVVVVLQHGWPESWSALWGVLAPVVAAALAAAISAVWNILLERLRTGGGD
jgi:branched-subunit amino acid transport protein